MDTAVEHTGVGDKLHLGNLSGLAKHQFGLTLLTPDCTVLGNRDKNAKGKNQGIEF